MDITRKDEPEDMVTLNSKPTIEDIVSDIKDLQQAMKNDFQALEDAMKWLKGDFETMKLLEEQLKEFN